MNHARIAPLCTALGALLIALASNSLHAETPVEPPAAPPPNPTGMTHTLFMGVDVAVQREDQLLPVRDVEGGSLVVKIKGKDVYIPTTGQPVNMKVGRSLKVSTESADIDKLVYDRIYTPGNDPYLKLVAAAGAAAGADAVVSLAQGEITQAFMMYSVASAAASRAGATEPTSAQIQTSADIDAAIRGLDNSIAIANSATNSIGNHASTYQIEAGEEAFDAIQVTFAVSSPTFLDDPYVIVLGQLRAGEATKARQYNWVYAQSLERLGPKPLKVYIVQGGLPRGYVIEELRVHLFNMGQEVATNVAPMRVEMNKDEAFEYAVIDYIGSHKNATLPAGLATGQNTEALRIRLANAYRGGPIYVEVAKNGRVGRAFGDKDCTKPLNDEELDAILSDVRFNPALSQGKAVDGVAPVKASPESS